MEVLPELEGVDQGTTIGALDPKAFRHLFASIVATQAGFAENAHGIGKLLADRNCRGRPLVTAKLVAGGDPDNPLLKDMARDLASFWLLFLPERIKTCQQKY